MSLNVINENDFQDPLDAFVAFAPFEEPEKPWENFLREDQDPYKFARTVQHETSTKVDKVIQ